MPWGMVERVRQKVGDAIVRGPVAGISLDETTRVAKVWVRLRVGMRAGVPLGSFGEASFEVRER